jgi:hypothetical protein
MDLRERLTTPTTRHPWETVRGQFFSRVLADALSSGSPVRVLDLGAGDAFVASALLRSLPAGSSITCVDSNYTDDHLSALRDVSPASVEFSQRVPDREFDVMLLLDVIEHVADDRALLADLVSSHLRVGGVVLVSVPAYQALFTQHDVALGHYRRYTRRELRHTVEAVGLETRLDGSLFGSLILPRAISKALEYARGIESVPTANLAEAVSTGVSNWTHGRIVTDVISRALAIDAKLCELAARHALPSAGLSVWALCERGR